MKVALLKGGLSAEREVSLSSGAGVAAALRECGYEVIEIDVGKDVASELLSIRPDVCFNALHGKYGEDGCIQGLLDIMGIPYTHSGVLASAIAMNKPAAKLVFKAAGIPIVENGLTLSGKRLLESGDPMPRPYVIKPVAEGSSVGVRIVFEGDSGDISSHNIDPMGEYLIEKYIPGREVQAAVLGSGDNAKALGAIEIVPESKFYDYEAKYTAGKARHLMPAPINKAAYDKICEYAVMAHRALGCRGITRSDFRYDDTNGEPGNIYILETNTQPGMTPLSLSPEIALHAGISYKHLVDALVKEALDCHLA